MIWRLILSHNKAVRRRTHPLFALAVFWDSSKVEQNHISVWLYFCLIGGIRHSILKDCLNNFTVREKKSTSWQTAFTEYIIRLWTIFPSTFCIWKCCKQVVKQVSLLLAKCPAFAFDIHPLRLVRQVTRFFFCHITVWGKNWGRAKQDTLVLWLHKELVFDCFDYQKQTYWAGSTNEELPGNIQ